MDSVIFAAWEALSCVMVYEDVEKTTAWREAMR